MPDTTVRHSTPAPQMMTEGGQRLAQARLARNITQEALAREAGIGLRTLRQLEAGAAHRS